MADKVPMIPMALPKTVQIQYYVTTLKPNTSEYAQCTLCKNYTEAKRTYKNTMALSTTDTLVSCIMTINRTSKDCTRSSDLVLARTAGKVKVNG